MTSTEIAHRPAAPLPDKVHYARTLADSGLLPDAYKRQPANVLYAIEYGEMIGLAPMAAITGIHVIKGKPTASAALMSALVRKAGHRLRVSGDDTHAVAEIVRSDDPEFTFRTEWTLQRAERAGLVRLKNGQPTGGGGNPTWVSYTAAMLKARAISEVCRDACEEALLGMHYTPEELGAQVDADGVPVRATSSREEAKTTPAPSHSPAAEFDWYAEIERLAGNADGLVALHAQVRESDPENYDVLAAIVEAGTAARAAEKARAAEDDTAGDEPDGVVDAELVEEQVA